MSGLWRVVVVKSDATERGVNCVLYTVHWLHFAQGLLHHGCQGRYSANPRYLLHFNFLSFKRKDLIFHHFFMNIRKYNFSPTLYKQ